MVHFQFCDVSGGTPKTAGETPTLPNAHFISAPIITEHLERPQNDPSWLRIRVIPAYSALQRLNESVLRWDISKSMDLWIGTSGFQYSEWKGSFYPEKLPVSKMLPYYAERFATTEINYSFRRIPSAKTIQSWAEATPPRFKFTFKAPERVTHISRLRDCEEILRFFAGVILELNDKLGIVLFQLPPVLKCDVPLLRAFLNDLPRSIRAAFEFRHDSWFTDEVFDALREHNAALCIAESERIAAPTVPTADFGYLRLRRQDYLESDVVRWADFVRAQAPKWRNTFVYFKHEESGLGPKLARQMMDKLSP